MDVTWQMIVSAFPRFSARLMLNASVIDDTKCIGLMLYLPLLLQRVVLEVK